MADPFAPPESRPRGRVDPYAAPATAARDPYATSAPQTGQVYPPMTATAPPSPPPHPDTHPRPEPANPGVFWMVAAVGVLLICLARLISFFVLIDDMESEDVAPALFGVVGIILLSLGLTAAAVMQRGLAMTWRIALLVAGGYFAVSPSGFGLFGLFGVFG